MLVGSARVDITPELGVGLAGHGPMANAAQGAFGRLFATLLLLEDDEGTRLLLVATDLFAGSRFLHELLGRELADAGLSTDRIVLAASHGHRTPSSLLGSLSFDRLAGPAWVREPWDHHFDRGRAVALGQRMVTGVRAILGPEERTADLVTLRPARVALSGPRMWGWSTNRTASALDGLQTAMDPDEALWSDPPQLDDAQRRRLGRQLNTVEPPGWLFDEGVPPRTPAFIPGGLHPIEDRPLRTKEPVGPGSVPDGHTIDEVLRDVCRFGDIAPVLGILPIDKGPRRPMRKAPSDRALVDARLHLLLAYERDGTPIGAFGVFGATPSLLGGRHAVFTGDAYGVASMVARTRMQTPVPVGIGGGALGDVNLVPRGTPLDEVRARGELLEDAAEMVQEVAEAFAVALVDALANGADEAVDDLRFRVGYLEVSPAGLGLDPFGRQSGTSLGGSELAGSPLAILYEEGMRSRPGAVEQQSPKPGIYPLEGPPEVWPLRQIQMTRAGTPWWSLVALPHECATVLANDLAVVVGAGEHPVTVVSPCGEFAGYANDRWGYVAQGYEGSMNLHGRYTGDALVRTFEAGLPQAFLPEWVRFTSNIGALPLRLGSHKERRRDKPNVFAASIKLHAGRFGSFGKVKRPKMEVVRAGPRLVVRAVVDGVRPDGPLADGPLVAVGSVDAGRTVVTPFTFGELEATDVNVPFLVWADVRKDGTRWRIQVEIPAVAGAIGLVLYAPITGGGVRFLDADGLFG